MSTAPFRLSSTGTTIAHSTGSATRRSHHRPTRHRRPGPVPCSPAPARVATGLTEADATYDRLTNAVAAWSSVRKDLAEWLADTLVERITVRVDLVASLGAPLRFRIEQIVDTEPAWVAAVHLPATAGGLVELLRVCGWTLWTGLSE